MKIYEVSKKEQDSGLSRFSMPIEVPDDETDVYWEAVEESDSDRLKKLFDNLKDQGESYLLEWKELFENRF